MGRHDKSSERDKFTEGQLQVKNAVKERRKCNDTESTTHNIEMLSIMIFQLS